MDFIFVLLVLFVLAALWTVMAPSLLLSSMGLAAASALLSVVMFKCGAQLAAVFELSVCAGLISVLFICTVSLTEAMDRKESKEYARERMSRFWLLPVVVILLSFAAARLSGKSDFGTFVSSRGEDVRNLLWNVRQLDILGQIIILMVGVFGVVILFREGQKK